MKTRIKEKGQMTIPAKIRDLMNLESNKELIIFASKDEMIIRPKLENPMKTAGFLGRESGVKNVKDLIARYEEFK